MDSIHGGSGSAYGSESPANRRGGGKYLLELHDGELGELSLQDGRQLYVDAQTGFVRAAAPGRDNADPFHRTWYCIEGRVLCLGDGRQLHSDADGWAKVEMEGD